MFGLGSDRKVFGIYFQRRLLLAGAHAARPRHPCRLRPAQIRNREIVGARAPGAARHGDDGLGMPSIFHYTHARRLIGIIRSGALYATDYRYLNDSTEGGEIRKLLLPILEAETAKITARLVEEKLLSSGFYKEHGEQGHRLQAEGIYRTIVRAANNV